MPTPCTDADLIAAIAAGDAVCLSGWDGANGRPNVMRATQLNLLQYKTVWVRLPWNGAFLGHLTLRSGRIGSGGDESE